MEQFFDIETVLTLNWINIELFWHWTEWKQNLYLYESELELLDQTK